MSEQATEQINVQLIKDCYAAFQRGDIQTILNNLTEDVQWVAPNVEVVAGTYRGRDGVAKFFEKVAEISDFLSFEPREYVAQRDRVITLGSYHATAKSTGRSYQSDWAMSFTLRDGKVSRFQEYTDTAAIQAALPSVSSATA